MVLLGVVLALGTCYNAVVAYALAQTSLGAIPLREKQTGAAEVRSWLAYLAATFDNFYLTHLAARRRAKRYPKLSPGKSVLHASTQTYGGTKMTTTLALAAQ